MNTPNQPMKSRPPSKLLDGIDIQGKDITADALLTQRELARYLVEQRHAHYHFTVKGNQPTLRQAIALFFHDRQHPDAVTVDGDHGRIETRKIWTTTALNSYLDFPHVGQAFVIERETIVKKTGQRSCETVYGLTSRPPTQADSAAGPAGQSRPLEHRGQLSLHPRLAL